jgi:hypothetical protein
VEIQRFAFKKGSQKVTRFRASKGRLERTTRFRVWVDDVILTEFNFDSYEKK